MRVSKIQLRALQSTWASCIYIQELIAENTTSESQYYVAKGVAREDDEREKQLNMIHNHKSHREDQTFEVVASPTHTVHRSYSCAILFSISLAVSIRVHMVEEVSWCGLQRNRPMYYILRMGLSCTVPELLRNRVTVTGGRPNTVSLHCALAE